MVQEFTKHIIFDLDGTIIDSKPEIISTYTKVFSEIPVSQPVDFDLVDFGATLNQVLLYIYKNEPDKIALAKQLFAQLYDTSAFEDTLVYDGVYRTLDILKEQGLALYIATNKRYTPCEKILKAKGLEPYFTDIMAAEMQPGITLSKSEMISFLMAKNGFKQGFMIGDTIGDITAGKVNSLTTIAVSYGYQHISELEAIKPDYMAHSFENLIKFVL